MKLINSSCSARARWVDGVQRYMRPLIRSLGTSSSYSAKTPVLTWTNLLFHLRNGRRNIISGVYQMTGMDGLHGKEEGVKGVIKMKMREAKCLVHKNETTVHCIVKNIVFLSNTCCWWSDVECGAHLVICLLGYIRHSHKLTLWKKWL